VKALLLLAALTLSGCTFPFVRSSARPARLVPPGGRLEHVWHVPAGTGVPEDVVGWSRRGCLLFKGNPAGRCYALTVWRHDGHTTLFSHSPFPFQPTSVRTADVTGDGHRDLLVTIECNDCNHAASAAAVYADVDGQMRRIYGNGFFDWSGDRGTVGVPGRQIVETAWGAWKGLVWFDVPHYGPRSSVCCPDYRIQTFLRWDGAGWRTARSRKVSSEHDNFLGQRPVPAP
jgi:hypothetical protein